VKWIRPPLVIIALVALVLDFDFSGIVYGTFWFLAGAAFAPAYDRGNREPPRWSWAAVYVIGYAIVTWLSFMAGLPYKLAIPSCILAALALREIGRALPASALVALLARETLAIYVMHVIFVAGIRIALTNLLHVQNAGLLIVVSGIAGICLPIIVASLLRRV